MPESAIPNIGDRRSREARILDNIRSKQAHRPVVNSQGGIVGGQKPYTEDAFGNYIGPVDLDEPA
ncbi:MAG: hypothetical protein Q7V58_07265 [Actinomycetota bacterium]|nr:hypothetical protein [Actinomycetota bacterium]